MSGAEVALRSESMEVESSTSLSVSTQDAVVRASGGVEGYVSEGVSVSAGGMWLRSGDALSVSSVSESRIVSGGRLVAEAGEGMAVSAGETMSVSAGAVSVSSTGNVGVSGSEVSVESSSVLVLWAWSRCRWSRQGRCR